MAATQIRGGQIKDTSIALAKLDTSIISGGKLLESLLPASAVGGMSYKGTHDASTTTPPAAAATENNGWYYIISVAGTIGGVEYNIGDWIVSNGTDWNRIDNTEATETAATTSFDNATSGLTATTVQAAIDEVEGRVQTNEGAIGTLGSLTTTEKGSLVGALNEVNAKKPSDLYVRETPTGAVDGSNAIFTLDNSPVAATLQVYLNGQLQEPTDDYTFGIGDTVTFVTAPLTGDKVRCIYFR